MSAIDDARGELIDLSFKLEVVDMTYARAMQLATAINGAMKAIERANAERTQLRNTIVSLICHLEGNSEQMQLPGRDATIESARFLLGGG